MLSDPFSLTVNSVAKSLPRTSAGENKAEYRQDDGTRRLSISHNYGKRLRHLARLDTSLTGTDPVYTDRSIVNSMSAYLVVDVPFVGISHTDQAYEMEALLFAFTESSYALVPKFLGGQS